MGPYNKCGGFAYVAYILGAAALAAAVAAAIHISTVRATSLTNYSVGVEVLASQALLLISSVEGCISSYPDSDNTFSSGAYPMLPDGATTSELECPGLRKRYCPDIFANTRHTCTEARLFPTQSEATSFAPPAKVAEMFVDSRGNTLAKVWAFARSDTIMVNGTNYASETPVTYVVLNTYARNTETTQLFKQVANHLGSYQTCVRQGATQTYLFVIMKGSMSTTGCL